MTEIDIEAMGNSPKRQRTDEGSTEERTIDELMKAKNYVTEETAKANPPWGIRLARSRPGGTVN